MKPNPEIRTLSRMMFRFERLKQIRDKALALEHYARQALNIQAERRAIEVRVRAERRASQLLAEVKRTRAGRIGNEVGRQPNSTKYSKAKREAKISDWQDEQFE